MNLSAIKHSLLARLNEINSHIKKVRSLDIDESDIQYPDYFFDDYLPLASLSFNAFENVFKNYQEFSGKNFKWALCFDELEIAPQWLQKELLTVLRSLSDQKILFKLTMVPLVVIDNSSHGLNQIAAREYEDFEIVRTWTFSKNSITDWEDFSRRIIQDKFKRRFLNKINPLSLFGSDNLDRNISLTFKGENDFQDKKGYFKGTCIWFLFKELAAFDKSFRTFLSAKEITPSNPIPVLDNQKDEIFRKIKPIVLHRFQFKS